jgi:hypothetical protein
VTRSIASSAVAPESIAASAGSTIPGSLANSACASKIGADVLPRPAGRLARERGQIVGGCRERGP